MPVEVRDRTDGLRLSAETEAAVYFCCLEAVQNAAKHADADSVVIEIEHRDDRVTFCVEDDGRGFDPATVVDRAQAWPTCATGSTPSAVGCGSSARQQGGTRVVGWVPARATPRARTRDVLPLLGLDVLVRHRCLHRRGHAAHRWHWDYADVRARSWSSTAGRWSTSRRSAARSSAR